MIGPRRPRRRADRAETNGHALHRPPRGPGAAAGTEEPLHDEPLGSWEGGWEGGWEHCPRQPRDGDGIMVLLVAALETLRDDLDDHGYERAADVVDELVVSVHDYLAGA